MSNDAKQEAGRELDAKVAREVFSYWGVESYEGNLVHGESNTNSWPVPTPHYSTDIAAAWQVVEKMRERGIYIDVRANR